LGVAHLLGIFLGSLSFSIFENIWKRCVALDLSDLKEYLDLTSTTDLEEQYKERFGNPLPAGSLNGASFLCSYYVWRIDPNLGLMTARSDAELLAARSLCLVIPILSLMPVLGHWIEAHQGVPVWWIWDLLLIPFFITSLLYFNYTRKKRVFHRFALFMVATSKVDRSSKESRRQA
jgi:hypothetical protein